MPNRQRIFIGIPCFAGVSAEVLEDYMAFAFHLGRRMPEYDFFIGIRSKAEQFRARNSIVDAAQAVVADWLLMLDDDMVIDTFNVKGPTSEYDFLKRLIAHNKDVCGVLYYQRTGEIAPVLMKEHGSGYRFLRDDEIEHKLQRVDVAGGGCLLIRMSIFDKLRQPFFEPEYQWGTDVQLCRQAKEKGFEVWADTAIELGHVRTEHVVITSRNKQQFRMANTVPGAASKHFIASDVYERLIADALEYTGCANLDEMRARATNFMRLHAEWQGTDAEWYRQHPIERICRQVWFNNDSPHKRQMTEYILTATSDEHSREILDFGCGIGITAFELARRGHLVTALDIRGTGTLEFLKWRCKKHDVPMNFIESDGGVPQLGERRFDLIVAMDSIEHIEGWRDVVHELGSRVRVNGVLFSNNGVLVDDEHPEHYHIDNKEFISLVMAEGLMPVNEITFHKKERMYAERANSQAVLAR